MTLTEQKSARRALIVAHIAGCEAGAAFADMLPMFGVAKSCLQRDLQRLKAAGEIVVVIGNLQTLWCIPARAEQTRQAVKAAAEAKAKARRERKNALRRTKGPRHTRTREETRDEWVRLVVGALASAPNGMTSDEIRAKINRGIGTVKRALPLAKSRGLCDLRRMLSTRVLWFHRDFFANMEELKTAHAKDAKRRRNKRNRETAKRRDLVAFERPMVHRIVPANQAPPLRPVGPSSVWGLAA
jgi:hypothetical protein